MFLIVSVKIQETIWEDSTEAVTGFHFSQRAELKVS